jgi:twitching motility two-component system response regulator PilH
MSKQTILVVDDSPTELKLVSKALMTKGYRVVTAVDGEDALAKAAAEKPSVVVLDVVLPKKNGFQVCRTLKTTDGMKDIKVLMLTSKSQDSDRYWGMKQGADAYMTKPFADDELCASVGTLV